MNKTVLKAKYEMMANQILNDVNTGSVILYYAEQTGLATTPTTLTDNPKNQTPYGGREPIDNANDRFDEGTTNSTYFEPISDTVKCRSYWKEEKFDRDGNLIAPVNICKVICSIDDINKLRNAIYASIDGIKAKMTREPVPYGLFGKQYCCSYWEAI